MCSERTVDDSRLVVLLHFSAILFILICGAKSNICFVSIFSFHQLHY
jgi:hypothetical protein